MLQVVLLFSVFMAILTVQTQKLRQAVIYIGLFSIVNSFVFILYHAPDVAMAEAIIGSAFSLIIYIITLQKYQLFTVYVPITYLDENDELMQEGEQCNLLEQIDVFCIKQSLEAQFIFTTELIEDIDRQHDYAIIIQALGEQRYSIYSHESNYKEDLLASYLSENLTENYKIDYTKVEV